MLFVFGKRTARIAHFIDNDHICYPCKAFDREINIYQPYFHFCFINVFPMAGKQMDISCRNCGDETISDLIVKKYEGRARTPLYLYSAVILFAGLAAFWFYWNKNNEKNKMEYLAHPAVGDVCNISKEDRYTTNHSFLRIAPIRGDSIMMLYSNLEYSGFVSDLADDNFFVKEGASVYKKKELRQMLDNNEIYAIKRDYSSGDAFNRIK